MRCQNCKALVPGARHPAPSGLVLIARAKKLKLANLCGYLLVTGDAWSNIDTASRSMNLSVNYCRQDDTLCKDKFVAVAIISIR